MAFYENQTIKASQRCADRAGAQFGAHLEELEQHVVEVGGDVHDADGGVLLTCRETESLLLLPPHHLQTPHLLPSGAIIPLQKSFCQYCQMHLATL